MGKRKAQGIQEEKGRAADRQGVPGVGEDIPVVAGLSREKKKQENLTFIDKLKLKHRPTRSYLIKMFFSNGTAKEFVIVTKAETFKFKGRSYYLRYEDSWFNITQNQYELNYFDDFTVPIDRAIQKMGDKRFFSVTPENMKPLIDMNYVKVLAQAQDFEKKMQTLVILQVLICFLLGGLIFFIYRLQKLLTPLLGG